MMYKVSYLEMDGTVITEDFLRKKEVQHFLDSNDTPIVKIVKVTKHFKTLATFKFNISYFADESKETVYKFYSIFKNNKELLFKGNIELALENLEYYLDTEDKFYLSLVENNISINLKGIEKYIFDSIQTLKRYELVSPSSDNMVKIEKSWLEGLKETRKYYMKLERLVNELC